MLLGLERDRGYKLQEDLDRERRVSTAAKVLVGTAAVVGAGAFAIKSGLGGQALVSLAKWSYRYAREHPEVARKRGAFELAGSVRSAVEQTERSLSILHVGKQYLREQALPKALAGANLGRTFSDEEIDNLVKELFATRTRAEIIFSRDRSMLSTSPAFKFLEGMVESSKLPELHSAIVRAAEESYQYAQQHTPAQATRLRAQLGRLLGEELERRTKQWQSNSLIARIARMMGIEPVSVEEAAVVGGEATSLDPLRSLFGGGISDVLPTYDYDTVKSLLSKGFDPFDEFMEQWIAANKGKLTPEEYKMAAAALTRQQSGYSAAPYKDIFSLADSEYFGSGSNLAIKQAAGYMVHIGDEMIDLGYIIPSMRHLLQRFSRSFQIPIAPGVAGINPLRLFPWFRPDESWLTLLHPQSRNPVLASMLGRAADETLEQPVLVVGNRAYRMAMPWTESARVTSDAAAATQQGAETAKTVERWVEPTLEELPGRWRVMRVEGETMHGMINTLMRSGTKPGYPSGPVAPILNALDLGNQGTESLVFRIRNSVRQALGKRSPDDPLLIVEGIAEGQLGTEQLTTLMHFINDQLDVNDLDFFRRVVQRLESRRSRLSKQEKEWLDLLAEVVDNSTSEADLAALLRGSRTVGASRSKAYRLLRFLTGSGGTGEITPEMYGYTATAPGPSQVVSEALREWTSSGHYMFQRINEYYTPELPEHVLGQLPGNVFGVPDPKLYSGKVLRSLVAEAIAKSEELAVGTSNAPVLSRVILQTALESDKPEEVVWALKSIIEQMLSMPASTGVDDLLRANSEKILSELYEFVAARRKWYHPWTPEIAGKHALRDMRVSHLVVRDYEGTLAQRTTQALGDAFNFFIRGTKGSINSLALQNYFFAWRLNQMLTPYGLGLSDYSMRSPGAIYGNLLLRRVLPVVGAVEGWKLINTMMANQPASAFAETGKQLHLTLTSMMDATGITHVKKTLVAEIPGLDQYFHPRSREELESYYEEEPATVRRGRFWLLGSRTPFIGEGVEAYVPNWYRAMKSDWQAAPNVDTSGWMYFLRGDSPLNFPLYAFRRLTGIRDRDWMARHFKERPYPQHLWETGQLPDGQIPIPLWATRSKWSALSYLLGKRSALEKIDEASTSTLIAPGIARTLPPVYSSQEVGYGTGTQQDVGRVTSKAYERRAITSRPALLGLLMGGTAGGPGGYGGYGGGGGGIGVGAGIGGGAGIGVGAGIGGGMWMAPEGVAYARGDRRRRPARVATITATDYAEKPEGPKEAIRTAIQFKQELHGLYGWAGIEVPGLVDRRIAIDSPDWQQAFTRRLWESRLGGLDPIPWSGELNEFYRRWFHRRKASDLRINPLPNNMPTWLPYRLQIGDPYRIPMGEVRLPGEAYLRLNPKVMEEFLQARASMLGKSPEDQVKYFLNVEKRMTQHQEEAVAYGERKHKAIQRRLRMMGVLEGAEVPVRDVKHRITGHIDAIIRMQNNQRRIIEIKTMSAERFERGQVFPEHKAQLLQYMYTTGIHSGGLLYVNREDPNQARFIPIRYSSTELQQYWRQLDEVRRSIREAIRRGDISVGHALGEVAQMEILADVAPYSREYYKAKARVNKTANQLSDEQIERVEKAKQRAIKAQRRYELYPYRNFDLVTRRGRVERISPTGAIYLEGEEKPIRLAGITIDRDVLAGAMEARNTQQRVEKLLAKYGIQPGKVIEYQVADRLDAVRNIRRRTTPAIIPSRRLFMPPVNRQLLQERGVRRDPEDTSYEAEYLFTSNATRRVRAILDLIAHRDSIFHNKFLRVRSPLEEWERGHVFGTRAGDWTHPFKSYVYPTITSIANKNIFSGALAGGVFASLFGFTKGSKRKLFLAGAVAGGLLSAVRSATRPQGHIPPRVRKRWEIDEYLDALKYVKYRALYLQEAAKAKREEHTDVERLYREMQRREERDFRLRRRLRREQIRLSTRRDESEEIYRRKMRRIRRRFSQRRAGLQRANMGVINLGVHARRALYYRNMYERTAYATTPGRLSQALDVVPLADRPIYEGILASGSRRERRRFYELLPRHHQRLFQKWLAPHKRPPERPSLESILSKYGVPDPSWKGWDPEFDLELLRGPLMRREGLLPIEAGVYPQQEAMSDLAVQEVGIPTPSPNYRRNMYAIAGGNRALDIHRATLPSPRGGNFRMSVQIEKSAEDERYLSVLGEY